MKGATQVENVYTTKQAAEYLGVHIQTVKNYIANGRLNGTLLAGKIWVFEQQELDRLLEETGGEFPRGRPAGLKLKRKSAPVDAQQDDDNGDA